MTSRRPSFKAIVSTTINFFSSKGCTSLAIKNCASAAAPAGAGIESLKVFCGTAAPKSTITDFKRWKPSGMFASAWGPVISHRPTFTAVSKVPASMAMPNPSLLMNLLAFSSKITCLPSVLTKGFSVRRVSLPLVSRILISNLSPISAAMLIWKEPSDSTVVETVAPLRVLITITVAPGSTAPAAPVIKAAPFSGI